MTTNIVDYRVVLGSDSCHLTDKVNRHVSVGWQPYGSVATLVTSTNHVRLYQATVKYGPSN